MKRIAGLLLLCAVLLSCPVAAEETLSTPNVASAILYEATTDTILYELNADRASPPASMTKVMTAILVLEENPELTGTLTVSPDAVSDEYCWWMDEKHLFAGEVVSYEDCMNYLLIPSGNEAATAFAIDLAGSVPAFVARMNEKAAELGCDSTHFEDPHGLSGSPHVTTPRDMLKISMYAMTFDRFREIVCKTSGQLPASNMREYPFFYETTNRVMYPRNIAIYRTAFTERVCGIKTGTTDEAGYTLSCCMKHDELVFYSVVMGGRDAIGSDGVEHQGNFLDTVALLTYADRLVPCGFAAGETAMTVALPVADALEIPVAAEGGLYILSEGETVVTPVFAPGEGLTLPLAVGAQVGMLSVTDAFGQTHTAPAVTLQAVEKPSSPLLTGALVLSLIAICAVALLALRRRRRG